MASYSTITDLNPYSQSPFPCELPHAPDFDAIDRKIASLSSVWQRNFHLSQRHPAPLVDDPVDPVPIPETSTPAPSTSRRSSSRLSLDPLARNRVTLLKPDSIIEVPECFRLPLAKAKDRTDYFIFKRLEKQIVQEEKADINNGSTQIQKIMAKPFKAYKRAIEKTGVPEGIVVCKIDVGTFGMGVFATKLFKKKAFIGFYSGIFRVGQAFDQNDYGMDLLMEIEIPAREDKDRKALFGKKHKSIPFKELVIQINGEEKGNFSRYINHSSVDINDPNKTDHSNVFSALCYVKGRLQTVLLARKKIEPGQQLFWDYGECYWNHRGIKPAIITPNTYKLDLKSLLSV